MSDYMNIDLQDIEDGIKHDHFLIHKKAAEEVIAKGGTIYVRKCGNPIGRATTLSELNWLLGHDSVQENEANTGN